MNNYYKERESIDRYSYSVRNAAQDNVTDRKIESLLDSGYTEVSFAFMKYISGYFNGTQSKDINIDESFYKRICDRFESENIVFFMDSHKVAKASSFSESDHSFTIWQTIFDKERFSGYFFNGVRLIDLCIDWKSIKKSGSDRFYLHSQDDEERINLYYFRVLVKDKMIDKTENKKYNEYTEKENGGIKMSLENTMRDAVAVNKDAARRAALIKIGNTANKTVVDILRKNSIPKKYQKFTNSPFFTLVVSNVAAASMKQLVPNKTKRVDDVADAMILASMIDITNMIDINAIIKQVMESVDLSSLEGKE